MRRAATVYQFAEVAAFRAAARSEGFRRDERGTMVILAILLLTMMLMMGGLAVDLMRYESTRVNLQQSLDRCTLTAASLRQQQDPESVVRDCMLKAGIADQLASITVVDGMNYRSVQSAGVADTRPMFLHMLGIPKFDAKAGSKAEQGLSNIEIALVLDVSGSMSGTKLANLKLAASEFIDTVFAQDVDHRVSVTIVPYNAQVNLPVTLRDQFNVVHVANVPDVNCAELPASVYTSAAIPLTTALPMMAYADVASSTTKSTSFIAPTSSAALPNYGSVSCRPNPVNLVRLPQTDPVTLKAQINALQAGGNTSITLGMKWGLTLLDPSMRPAFADLIGRGVIPAAATGRPFDHDDTHAMKVVVLMTDGEHVSHSRVVDAYKTGASPIWRSTGDGLYSVRHTTGRPAAAGTKEYFVPHLCVSTACTDGSNTAEAWRATPWDSGLGSVQQDWKDVWARMKLSYVAWQFYARALGTSSTTRNAVYNSTVSTINQTYESAATMDDHLQASCSQARDEGVVVFGIALEAPPHGQDVIRNCASSVGHYYDASALTISTAFRSIATNITQLKLTQ